MITLLLSQSVNYHMNFYAGTHDCLHTVDLQMLSSVEGQFCEEPTQVCSEFRHWQRQYYVDEVWSLPRRAHHHSGLIWMPQVLRKQHVMYSVM